MTPVLAFTLIAAASLVTSFISGILGMAGGMILMGVLLALLTLPAAMMLHGIAQLAANGWRAFLLRREVDWRVFRGFALGALAALAAFIALHLVVSKGVAMVAMGLTPFIGLALPERFRLNVERRGHSFACGAACTALSLMAGVSGPILDLFFVRSKMGRREVVATKALSQSLGHLMKIGYFGGIVAAAGATVEPLLAAAVVVLGVVGTTLSKQVLDRITDADFRRWTRWTVMTLGVVYLVSGIITLAR
ncbi:MAG: sulfite exporter TauE/SafE family protein [Betaproteobacteria bacterium]|nr:sulfite exporter TauE/SafE family protein [Betaproteobacteria bacterium]